MAAIEVAEQRDQIEHPARGLGRADRHLAPLQPGQRVELSPQLADRRQRPARMLDEHLPGLPRRLVDIYRIDMDIYHSRCR